jgi:MFS family permease
MLTVVAEFWQDALPLSTGMVSRVISTAPRRGAILAAVCLSVLAINIDTTIINVALPSLTRELGAGTSDLQWIVDGYSLSFAALVLAAGSLGDRYGRRPALLVGLVGFAVASAVGALCGNPGQLIAVRFLMGTFAALIFPTTLSVITNAFPDRWERAGAVGAWGAVAGLGVAVGPVLGGLLLREFSWPSVFVALVPVALVAAGAVFLVVPESRDPATPPVDRPGLLTASVTVGSLVYTIIEAPTRGWASTATFVGFAIAILSGIAFVLIERDSPHPMLDVTLFAERAFSAASGSVTVAFFSLFGFIFLITHQRRPRSLSRQLPASPLTDLHPVLHRLVIATRQRSRATQRARQVICLQDLHRFLRSLHDLGAPRVTRQQERAPDYRALRTEPWGEQMATHRENRWPPAGRFSGRLRGRGTTSARCPGVLFRRRPPEPGVTVSDHRALQRLFRD